MSAHTRPRRFAHTIFRNTSSKVEFSERAAYVLWRMSARCFPFWTACRAQKRSATTVRFWRSPPVRVDRELQQRDRTDAFAGHFRYTAFGQGTDAASSKPSVRSLCAAHSSVFAPPSQSKRAAPFSVTGSRPRERLPAARRGE
jgi:hypothetical protein